MFVVISVSPVSGVSTSRTVQPTNPLHQSTDEKLGFEAATAALGLKANVSEAEHPLLCEGTRRQRGELAVTMLVQYKDDQVKLSKVRYIICYCINTTFYDRGHVSDVTELERLRIHERGHKMLYLCITLYRIQNTEYRIYFSYVHTCNALQ